MLAEDLSDIDYYILDFIALKQPVGIEELREKFLSVQSLDYRIHILSTPEYEYVRSGRMAIENSYCLQEAYEEKISESGFTSLEYLQIYSLTELGQKLLQDHKISTKKARKNLWLKNAWIPILVSLATNLVLRGIGQLLPLIQQWVSSFL